MSKAKPMQFRSLKISADIGSDDKLGEKVEQANAVLAELLGPSVGTTNVEWSVQRDPARITLRLSDWTGDVLRTFKPGEFDNPWLLRSRLHRIWGDLLQARSDRQLGDLLSQSGQQ